MGMLGYKIPGYIYEKSNIVRLILLTALFALVFINIYKPFSSSSWYSVSEFKFFVFSSLIILTGVLVVVISRIVMYYWGKKHEITTGAYALWILLEIFFMSLFYTIYTLVLNPERTYLGKIPDLGRIPGRNNWKAGHSFPYRFPHEPYAGQLVQPAGCSSLGRTT